MVPGAPAGLQAFMRQALLLFMRANRRHLAEPTLAIGTALVKVHEELRGVRARWKQGFVIRDPRHDVLRHRRPRLVAHQQVIAVLVEGEL